MRIDDVAGNICQALPQAQYQVHMAGAVGLGDAVVAQRAVVPQPESLKLSVGSDMEVTTLSVNCPFRNSHRPARHKLSSSV